MAKVICAVITSLDGFIEDQDGKFDWALPDEQVHTFIYDHYRSIGTYLYGRRRYETMAAWKIDPDLGSQSPSKENYARIWHASDKIVFSKTLQTISTRHTRIERNIDPASIRRI